MGRCNVIVKFAGKISPMGEKLIIIIPKEYHDKIIKHMKKQLMIEVNEL